MPYKAVIHSVWIYALCFSSCSGSPAVEEQTRHSPAPALNTLEADTFLAPDSSFFIEKTLSDEDKRQIELAVFSSKWKMMRLPTIPPTEFPALYKRLLLLLPQYQDSTALQKDYIKQVFLNLEDYRTSADWEEKTEIRLRLELAALSSDIYAALSVQNAQTPLQVDP